MCAARKVLSVGNLSDHMHDVLVKPDNILYLSTVCAAALLWKTPKSIDLSPADRCCNSQRVSAGSRQISFPIHSNKDWRLDMLSGIDPFCSPHTEFSLTKLSLMACAAYVRKRGGFDC